MHKTTVLLMGTDDYFLSSDGTLIRKDVNGNTVTVTPDYSEEYPFWSVFMQGYWRKMYCHREMAIHFIPNPKHLPVVHHKNDNKRDFRLENLQWITQAENVKMAHKQGSYGTTTTHDLVQKIKHFLYQGFSIKDIASWTGVNYQTIWDIKAGRRHA